jgi:hypothetical protein
MPTALHLLRRRDPSVALATIARQLANGDRVTVALIDGATAPPDLPADVAVRRVPADCSHEQLLDLIFEADSVITW